MNKASIARIKAQVTPATSRGMISAAGAPSSRKPARKPVTGVDSAGKTAPKVAPKRIKNDASGYIAPSGKKRVGPGLPSSHGSSSKGVD